MSKVGRGPWPCVGWGELQGAERGSWAVGMVGGAPGTLQA